MTEFKCKNCNLVFNKFCDTVDDSVNASCPDCGSHWVEIYYRRIDPEQFKPFKKDPYLTSPFLKLNTFVKTW